MREPGPGQLLGLRPLLGPGGDQELPHGAGRGVPGERPPLPGDKEEGQECRAFHPSAVKAFKIQTRLNATTIAQEEAKKADQVAAVERSAAVLHELQGGAIDGGGDGPQEPGLGPLPREAAG